MIHVIHADTFDLDKRSRYISRAFAFFEGACLATFIGVIVTDWMPNWLFLGLAYAARLSSRAVIYTMAVYYASQIKDGKK